MTVLLPSYVSIDTQFDIEFVKLCLRIVPLLLYSSLVLSRTRRFLARTSSLEIELALENDAYLRLLIAVISSRGYFGPIPFRVTVVGTVKYNSPRRRDTLDPSNRSLTRTRVVV